MYEIMCSYLLCFTNWHMSRIRASSVSVLESSVYFDSVEVSSEVVIFKWSNPAANSQFRLVFLVVFSNPEGQLLAPGCLSHPDDPLASSLLGAFAVLKHKVLDIPNTGRFRKPISFFRLHVSDNNILLCCETYHSSLFCGHVQASNWISLCFFYVFNDIFCKWFYFKSDLNCNILFLVGESHLCEGLVCLVILLGTLSWLFSCANRIVQRIVTK
jgi:hypothetical protein